MHRTEQELSPLIEPEETGLLQRLIRRIRTASRRRRAAIFHRHFAVGPDTRLLDLGGGDGTHVHYLLAGTAAVNANVYVADIDHEAVDLAARRFGYRPVRLTEGAALPFPDGFFDIAVCSSVLEHVTIPKQEIWREWSGERFRRRARAAQAQFATELARVARGYFVQVPHRGFPVETHAWLPLLQFLPRALQCLVIAAANHVWIKKTIPDFHLPSRREMAGYFPGAELRSERWLGLTKSLIAIQPAAQRPQTTTRS